MLKFDKRIACRVYEAAANPVGYFDQDSEVLVETDKESRDLLKSIGILPGHWYPLPEMEAMAAGTKVQELVDLVNLLKSQGRYTESVWFHPQDLKH